ncbi:MAG: HD domain-containing protein, partial [Actinomycetota bacterium]|nr:HD domain-containing protein [Actinomycetota bacterium]
MKLAAVFADLSRALESRDPYSRGHAARVTALADAVARWLGWGEERLGDLQMGGLLHDIGKLAVPERLLHKRGPLSPSERDELQRHPAAGARLIEPIPSARPALPYVLYHHERWDGTGYPFGRAEGETPEEARLLAVADAYDAMTSTRPYR